MEIDEDLEDLESEIDLFLPSMKDTTRRCDHLFNNITYETPKYTTIGGKVSYYKCREFVIKGTNYCRRHQRRTSDGKLLHKFV